MSSHKNHQDHDKIGLSSDLRSLRHHYIQSKIPRNQLHLLVEQGGWDQSTYLKFKRELNIIDSDNSLELIRHITHNISVLLKENGSVGEQPLMKHFQNHPILFHADFQLLLMRHGMVALEDLMDLLIVSRLAKANEIESYAKAIFCLNVNKFMEISQSEENHLVKKRQVENNLEKKFCVTSNDLSQLLNHVLKLDRLKRILDMTTAIKNYLRLHPINTFNSLRAFKLEFDFNYYDMKFLRDLKILNNTWYQRYLVSQTSDTGLITLDTIDDEQEQDDDHNEFKFRSDFEDDDFDFDSLNDLFDTEESPIDKITEQYKQISQKSQIDEDRLRLSIHYDDLHAKESEGDEKQVIEQFYPDATRLGPQRLLPYLSDNQQRLFIELDFAENLNIEDKREETRQQMISYPNHPEKEQQISNEPDLHLPRLHIDPWLEKLQKISPNDDNDNPEFYTDLHKELNNLRQNVQSDLLQQRIDQIESVLQEHNQQIADIESNTHKKDSEGNQSLLGTRLELLIRTLDIDLQLAENGKTSYQDSSSILATNIERVPTIYPPKKIPHDLLKIDISERFQAIKDEYLKLQTIKSAEPIDSLNDIYNEIQNHLLTIINARHHSNHPNFPLDTQLKFLPIDITGKPIEPDLYLVDEHDLPISDPINLIRLPVKSDHFEISDDKHELIVVDENNLPLSDPITFKKWTSEPVEFEYTNEDNRQTVQIIQTSNKSIALNVKSIPSDKPPERQALFVVDKNNQPLSKPIQLIDQTTSDLNLGIFLYDETTDERVLLTPEQYLITIQQAEFTSRKFLSYIIDRDRKILSEPIELSELTTQIRQGFETTTSNKLKLFRRKSHEYDSLNDYIQNRLDKLKTEEKVLEYILPLLDKQYENSSIEQVEYKRQQSNMDHLLAAMESFLQLDERLNEYRTTETVEQLEIQNLENNLIDQLIEISSQLDDLSITQQVQYLTNHLQGTQLLEELRPIILSGIKTRSRLIQENFETLLISIQQQSNLSEQVRFDYIQYLHKRFDEELEHEKTIEQLYDKIERMQYDFHQKQGTSSIKIEDLLNEVKHKYNINEIPIPFYLKTKNEKLIYLFNSILRLLNNELQMIEQYQLSIHNEIAAFHIEPMDNESFYYQQKIFIENQLSINQHRKLSKSIKKFKVLLNKLETVDEKNLQYDFLFSKFHRFYDLLVNKYQIDLPLKTNIPLIRSTLHNTRKKLKKQLQELDKIKNDTLQKLDGFKKKEEYRQRSKIALDTQESQLGLLRAYIQQSDIEPINIHHEYYAMKIQQIFDHLILTPNANVSKLDILFSDLKAYEQILIKQKTTIENKLKNLEDDISTAREYSLVDSLVREQIEDLVKKQNEFKNYQQSIVKIQTSLNEIFNAQRINQLPSGQQLMHSISPSFDRQYQIATKASIQEESSFKKCSFQYSSSIDSQQESLDPKLKFLRSEINYLKKQHAGSIAIGDYAQKLAAEQMIFSKIQTLKSSQDDSKISIENQYEVFDEKSIDSFMFIKNSLRNLQPGQNFDEMNQFDKTLIEQKHQQQASLISLLDKQIPPAVSKLLPSIGPSLEQVNMSLVTTNAKQLYEELQKMQETITKSFENTQITSDAREHNSSQETLLQTQADVTHNDAVTMNTIRLPQQTRLKSNSIVAMSSSLLSTKRIEDLPLRLSVVENQEKYSIIRAKSKDRHVGKSIERSFFKSQREYGEVYIRHRPIEAVDSVSSIDEQREKTEAKLRDKIKRKTRLVKLERAKQGNTVIHQQLDLSKRTFLIPQHANYEEYLEPIPPLIHIKDPPSVKVDQSLKINDRKLPLYPPTLLSPVEEEISFDFMEEDLTTKQTVVNTDEKLPEKFDSPIEVLSNSFISQVSQQQKLPEEKSSGKTLKSVIIKEVPDDQYQTPQTYNESFSTEGFSIEQETQSSTPLSPKGTVVYHRVGRKLKGKKKFKPKKYRIEFPLLIPRKAVPFVSATDDKQINVEDDLFVQRKKKRKKRKRSTKSHRKRSRSKSRGKTKSKIDDLQTDSTSVKNKDVIEMHLIKVKRYTTAPLSPINFDQTRHQSDDRTKIKSEKSRLHALKPMVKNFGYDHHAQKNANKLQTIDAYDLDKELFEFTNDTKEIDQPAIFTEYIPELFEKQAEEKQIRRVSLTAIKPDENFLKRLAPRVPLLYQGWQSNDTLKSGQFLIFAHTDEFRPLNKYIMSDISYYFDDDFIDESGLFQNQRNTDKIESRTKQPTQRFRDDYLVKEFFTCWKNYTTEQARIAELRRKRLTIDFREFWFQDALSDPFYSYFEQPIDYHKKQNAQHQMAYRLHKRLVRTGREQPKETMNGISRSSFIPILFNLPTNNIDRQLSLTRRRQLINHDSMLLSNLITKHDEILPLIRERLHSKNHRDELAIKNLLLKSSILDRGTIQDLDQLIHNYYTFILQKKTTSSVVKLPMLKISSHQSVAISQ